MEQIRSADVLANFPQVDEEKLNAALAAEAAASNRKIIVLDDDPTGVQTVHDIYVYTDWTVESLRKGFAAPEKLFFILTNSRGFTVAETTKAHREIAENTAKVAREFGMDYLIISRGDSTLRGHYPLETDLLREVTEAENGYKMDGDILCPYFREGGRFTLDNVHYVRYGAELVPCGQTEFAKDETFGYHASNLCEYIEEKTGGKVRAGDVTCISLESLRAMDFDGIEAQLLAVHDYGHVIVNAVADCDVKVFAVALYRTMAKGRHFTIRSAAALVKAIGNISDQPLLTREKMVTQESKAGGIIVVGSHTKKTTAQLEELKKATGTAEELTAQIAALQEQNRKDKQAHEAEVARIRLDAAVDKALTESGARNNIAVKALLAAFLKDAKVGEDGSVKGLAAEIETLAKGESTSFLFDNTKGAVIKGMKPGEAGDGAGYGGEVNPFAAKTFDLEAQGKLFRENPDAARALARQAGVKFV